MSTVHEPPPPPDPDAPLNFSMEGFQGQPPSPLIPRFWSPGWNSRAGGEKFQEEVGGPLRGGDPGRRLIEPARAKRRLFYADIPAAFTPRRGEWLILPGLSYLRFRGVEHARRRAIAELAPEPLSRCSMPQDAARLGVADGQQVTVHRGRSRLSVARPRAAVAPGRRGTWPGRPARQPLPALPAWGRSSP